MKTEIRTIRDAEVTTTQLPFTQAWPLLFDLGGIVAGALTDGGKIDPKARQTARAMAMLRMVDPQQALPLAMRLLQSTYVIKTGSAGDKEKIELTSATAFDRAFSGDIELALEILSFALEVNFGDFFDVGSSDSDETAPDPQSASQDPKESS